MIEHPVILLDVDGVICLDLHRNFDVSAMNQLWLLLLSTPDARIVLNTAWPLDDFVVRLRGTDCAIADYVLGHTGGHGATGLRWLRENVKPGTPWVALDDSSWNGRAWSRLVRTPSQEGFRPKHYISAANVLQTPFSVGREIERAIDHAADAARWVWRHGMWLKESERQKFARASLEDARRALADPLLYCQQLNLIPQENT